MADSKSKVYVMKTTDRKHAIAELMDKFELSSFLNANVALKANYNSADPFPASTHMDTLKNIIKILQNSGANEINLAERSGMGNTREVLDKMGVLKLSEELGFNTIVLNEEKRESWHKISGKGNHWLKGFYLPKLALDADKVVQTCCLKTHRFGGHFTLSLKNSIGWVGKKVPGDFYDYMAELHVSPFQRQMIAEVNKYYNTDLIIMDGIKAFVSGGPHKGQLAEPNLMLASSDRVAIDAVGIAILRLYDVQGVVGKGPIFDQMQIKKAAEIGIGVSSVEDIEIIPLNDEVNSDLNQIQDILEDK